MDLKKISTMACTYYVQDEIVNYYNKNNTKVYALLIDMTIKRLPECII